MTGKYDVNPLHAFYTTLDRAIDEYVSDSYINDKNKIDQIAKLILSNNGCDFVDESYQLIYKMNEDISVMCIFGAKGNNVNVCYDVFEFNGMTYFVIFMDCFEGIDKSLDADDEFERKAKEFMGYSEYFDTIVSLTNKFIALIVNPATLQNGMSTTAAADNHRFAPILIAGKILNEYHKLTENDIYGIELDYLNELLGRYDLALYGIREMQ